MYTQQFLYTSQFLVNVDDTYNYLLYQITYSCKYIIMHIMQLPLHHLIIKIVPIQNTKLPIKMTNA